MIVDSTTINCPNLFTNEFNGHKKKKCTKIHVVLDLNKNVKLFEIGIGSEHDSKFLQNNFHKILDMNPRNFLADAAYFSSSLKSFFESSFCRFLVPKKFQKITNKLYKKRILIENFFASLKQFRGIERSFVRKLENLKSNLSVAFSLLIL